MCIRDRGTSAADGNGGVYLDEAQRWIDFMNEHGISWANWSLDVYKRQRYGGVK